MDKPTEGPKFSLPIQNEVWAVQAGIGEEIQKRCGGIKVNHTSKIRDIIKPLIEKNFSNLLVIQDMSLEIEDLRADIQALKNDSGKSRPLTDF